MYAIVDIAGKQYKVSEGAKLKVASLDKNTGGNVSFDKVLLTDNGKSVKVGTPTLKGVNINATILEHGRERKILIYKKKRRKGYQRKNGHRQGYTLIEITKIKATTGTTKRAPTKAKKEKQETNFYKGKEGLKAIFEDQLNYKEILILGASPQAYEILKFYFKWYDKKRIKKKIKVKIIAYDRKITNIPLAEIRYLPKKYESPVAMNIYGNKTAIILWAEKPIVIAIREIVFIFN